MTEIRKMDAETSENAFGQFLLLLGFEDDPYIDDQPFRGTHDEADHAFGRGGGQDVVLGFEEAPGILVVIALEFFAEDRRRLPHSLPHQPRAFGDFGNDLDSLAAELVRALEEFFNENFFRAVFLNPVAF